jgi:hypothetical protein
MRPMVGISLPKHAELIALFHPFLTNFREASFDYWLLKPFWTCAGKSFMNYKQP